MTGFSKKRYDRFFRKRRKKDMTEQQQRPNNFVLISWKLLLLFALIICVIFGGVLDYYRMPTHFNTVTQEIEFQFAVPPNNILETQQAMGVPPLYIPRCNSSCLLRFGKDGEWIQDWNFAAEHGQYEEP
jgi:hypothetical protein